MIPVETIPLNASVFSYVVEDETIQYHFWVDYLAHLVDGALSDGSAHRTYVEICNVPLDPSVALSFRHTRGIEQDKLDAIASDDKQLTPLLVCEMEDGNTTLMVDGHHRYVKWCDAGWEGVVCILIQPEIWKQCLISGMPVMTEDEVLCKPRKP